MSETWNTKWGTRRVRQAAPTLAEALAAAQCLTGDPGQQAEIAAELMGVDVAAARSEMARLGPAASQAARRTQVTLVAPSRERGVTRTVVIERKASRRLHPPGRPAPRPQPSR